MKIALDVLREKGIPANLGYPAPAGQAAGHVFRVE